MRRAFTLIELLIVVGVIALLIGILLPALGRARAASQKTACLAQLADVGRSFEMYRNDNDLRHPPAAIHPLSNAVPGADGQPITPADEEWQPELRTFLAPYSGDGMRVLVCPADVVLAPRHGESYFYNGELGLTRLNDTVTYKIFGGDVTRVPVLRDGATYHGGQTPFATLFADGHAAGNFWPSPDEVETIREIDPGNFFQGFEDRR